jgi:hypothetical protein
MAERLIFATVAYVFHNFDLGFRDMNEETGRSDGLLKLFPPKSSRGLTVNIVAARGRHIV